MQFIFKKFLNVVATYTTSLLNLIMKVNNKMLLRSVKK